MGELYEYYEFKRFKLYTKDLKKVLRKMYKVLKKMNGQSLKIVLITKTVDGEGEFRVRGKS